MYVPHNVCVYNKALAGCQAGLVGVRAYPLDPHEADWVDPAERADAYAQAVDTAWGSASFTNADLDQIFGISQSIWANGRSAVTGVAGLHASGYTSLAVAVVAATQAGTTQIITEGINPNGCGGGGGGGTLITERFVASGPGSLNISVVDNVDAVQMVLPAVTIAIGSVLHVTGIANVLNSVAAGRRLAIGLEIAGAPGAVVGDITVTQDFAANQGQTNVPFDFFYTTTAPTTNLTINLVCTTGGAVTGDLKYQSDHDSCATIVQVS